MPTFREARRCKRAEQLARAHPISWMLRRVAAQAPSVHGPATLWLNQLNSVASDDIKARDDWPQTPEQLARIFSELREGLAALGVTLTRTRAKICGTIHRVWRVESVFTRQFSPKPQTLLLSGKTDEITPIEAQSAKLSPIKAESGADYSDFTGAPTMPTKRRKTTVEECARVTAAEAPHVGATTAETQIGGTNARRLWAVCPACAKRVRFLYQLPDGGKYLCRTCHNLTTTAQQKRGTKAAFVAWLTPERWENAVNSHPATAELHQAHAEDWRANVEPFDIDKIGTDRRAELLKTYASEEAIKRVFERRCMEWSDRAGARGAQTSARIYDDLFKDWTRDHRSSATQGRREAKRARPSASDAD